MFSPASSPSPDSNTPFTGKALLLLLLLFQLTVYQASGEIETESVRAMFLDKTGLTRDHIELSFVPVGGNNDLHPNTNTTKTANFNDQDQTVQRDEDASLIVKGDPTFPGDFRHQAMLMVKVNYQFYFICGGSIVGPRHVLTAAHCILPYMEGERGRTYPHYIMVGENNRTLGTRSSRAQVARVTHFKRPTRFVSFEANDIALLYLDRDIVETNFVQYAKLATPEDGDLDGSYCYISGWGRNEEGKSQILLQYAGTYVLSRQDCQNMWAIAGGKITPHFLCVYNYPYSTCRGDSGGPLTCGNVVVGLSSWSATTCHGCRPQAFTRISWFHRWIKSGLKRRRRYQPAP